MENLLEKLAVRDFENNITETHSIETCPQMFFPLIHSGQQLVALMCKHILHNVVNQ